MTAARPTTAMDASVRSDPGKLCQRRMRVRATRFLVVFDDEIGYLWLLA